MFGGGYNMDSNLIKLKNKIKDLLLSNSTIEKSFEMGNLKFNIKLIYTKEYINFYKGKRKIIFN